MERAIAGLESQGEVGVRTFGSGLAAVAAVFGALLKPGDKVVMQGNAYFAARQLLEELFAPMGVRVNYAPVAGLTDPATIEGAKLVWLETTSIPML